VAQVVDAVSGEGGNAILADAIDPEAAVFREHVGLQLEEPVFVLAEQVGDVANGKDMGDDGHDQAARLCGAERGRQFHGSSSSILCAECSAMRARTSASQACGSMSFNLAVTIRLYRAAARCPPRSEPANSHDFLPRATPRGARSAAQADAAVVEKPGEGRPAFEHIVHRLGEIVAARQLGSLLTQPALQISDQRRAQLLPNRAALLGALAVDCTLDVEQGVDAPDSPAPAARSR